MKNLKSAAKALRPALFSCLFSFSAHGDSPYKEAVLEAASNWDSAAIQKLIDEKGVDLSHSDYSQIFHTAAVQRSRKIILEKLGFTLGPNEKLYRGEVMEDALRFFQFLQENGAGKWIEHQHNGFYPLHTAIIAEYHSWKNELWHSGSKPFGPLEWAPYALNESIARALIFAGAEVNSPARVKGASGISPLHIASKRGMAGMAKILVYHGAEINSKDSMGNTPLHYLFMFGDSDARKDINSKSGHPMFFFPELSLSDDLWEILKTASALVDSGANICAANDKGAPVFSFVYPSHFRSLISAEARLINLLLSSEDCS